MRKDFHNIALRRVHSQETGLGKMLKYYFKTKFRKIIHICFLIVIATD